MSDFMPILPTYQTRDLSNLELQKLLNRLFQELDDQNTGLDEMERILSEIALRSNVDYKRWIKRDTNVSLDTGTMSWNDSTDPLSSIHDTDLLQDLLAKRQDEGSHNIEDESTMLKILINREDKLTKHYESVIDSYQELLQNIAMLARTRREDTFGVYMDEPHAADDDGVELRQTLQAMQIDSRLKERALYMKKNAELLNYAAANKAVEIKLTKSAIAEEAEKLKDVLNKD